MNDTGSYIGKKIDRYEFQSSIGKGTFGEVYQAFDQRLLRHVAIKVSFPYLANKERDKEFILREARIIARAEHANIVPIYDVLDHDQSVLIVMRLIRGEDLGVLMRHLEQPVPINEAFTIMHQVIRGMGYAHRKGVVHSDLKPGNILIAEDCEATIMDFGLAALLEMQRPDKGKLYGTPFYIPPEQINGSYLDARSDIYSLGMILYMMITGHHPFKDAETIQDLLTCQLRQTPKPPREINPAIPDTLSLILLKALEKEPVNRFYSCDEFLGALEDALPGKVHHKPEHKDLRWNPRVNVELEGRIKLDHINDHVPVKIVNLSVSGASMLVPKKITAGSQLQLEFEIPEDDNPVRMACNANVLWVDQKQDKELVETGISFEGLADMDKQCIGLFVRNLLLR